MHLRKDVLKAIVIGILLGLAVAFMLLANAIRAKSEPVDPCGSGKFYNSYSNACIPTDRGALPQPGYHSPGSNDGIPSTTGGFGGTAGF